MVHLAIIGAMIARSTSPALDHHLPYDHYIGQLSNIINLATLIRSVNKLLMAKTRDDLIVWGIIMTGVGTGMPAVMQGSYSPKDRSCTVRYKRKAMEVKSPGVPPILGKNKNRRMAWISHWETEKDTDMQSRI
jgi:hypothetical protein